LIIIYNAVMNSFFKLGFYFFILIPLFFHSCKTWENSINLTNLNEEEQISSGLTDKKEENMPVEENPLEVSLRDFLKKDGWNVDEIDTARDTDYLTEDEKDVILATNAVRSDPEKFANLYVIKEMEYYEGTLMLYPGEIAIQTQEGVKPVKELYSELIQRKKLGLLYPSRGMSQAAADHALDQAKTGRIGHVGEDGSDPFERMNRYGKWVKTAGENIAYGPKRGLRIILGLLIDDGVPSRGHRTNILKENYNLSGVGIDFHPLYGYSCTINYAGEYNPL
jgi:uncharacterized protein YkwD